MNNEDILKNAVEKAVKNGWDAFGAITNWKEMDTESWRNFFEWILREKQIPTILFSHDFAKSFFGEKGYENRLEDLEHEWEIEHYEADMTPVYNCKKLCGVSRRGDGPVLYDEFEGYGQTTDNPKFAGYKSLIFSAHGVNYNLGWLHHLQRMVQETNPLTYLEKFLS